ncbi:MAG TPA: homoserine kinase [Vicinamibacterales bacterium]|nr:homoserine kinase [Vicinamibacterales bacterium]
MTTRGPLGEIAGAVEPARPRPRDALDGLTIVVPGSISNLGPGFDALAVAVDLYLRVRVVGVRPGAPDSIAFDFGGAAPPGENRIETAYRLARQRAGRSVPGLHVEVRSDIPFRAGLGSSGAATIAGLRLYELAAGVEPALDVLSLACTLEGHPDNAAASLLGGLTLGCLCGDGRVLARSWPWPPGIRFIVATPALELETAVARRALPASLPLADAVFNLQRALLLVHALGSGRYDDLREALADRWHQPHRAPLVPGLAEALAFEHPGLLGVCLSGAGPSIAALAVDRFDEIASLFQDLYRRLGMACTVRTLAAAGGASPAAPPSG